MNLLQVWESNLTDNNHLYYIESTLHVGHQQRYGWCRQRSCSCTHIPLVDAGCVKLIERPYHGTTALSNICRSRRRPESSTAAPISVSPSCCLPGQRPFVEEGSCKKYTVLKQELPFDCLTSWVLCHRRNNLSRHMPRDTSPAIHSTTSTRCTEWQAAYIGNLFQMALSI